MKQPLVATRAAGLERLKAFTPCMGLAYAESRNYDYGPGQPQAVSGLSLWVRHRLLLESELIETALAAHGGQNAEAFIAQVFWRSYFKGWLELRPAVWTDYSRRVVEETARMAADSGMQQRFAAAGSGRTGIDCFDAWTRELIETGTLHNHARMWFASIWIFTLNLPWVLGADFFLCHLIDGDAAANTLSWRWVAGSQTKGKHYVARADNIARFTSGRFDPRGQLDEVPDPIVEPDAQEPAPLPRLPPAFEGRIALLLHEDDLHAESHAYGNAGIVALAGLSTSKLRSPLGCAPLVTAWAESALADGLLRAEQHFGVTGHAVSPDAVAAWAARTGCKAVVTPWAPVGWTADALAGLESALGERGLALHRLRRPWDEACWPLATKGFFAFRENIPGLIRRLLPDA